MTIIVGSLAFQNWHRQVRQKGLGPQQAMDYVIDKTAAAAKRFGFSPMGIDLGVARFPSTDRAYLDELKARLAEPLAMSMAMTMATPRATPTMNSTLCRRRRLIYRCARRMIGTMMAGVSIGC